MQTDKGVPPFMGDKLISFLPRGTNANQCFASYETVHEVSNQMRKRARVDLVDLGQPDPDQTRDKFMIVDLISEIEWSELHFVISESWSDTRLPVDAQLQIEQPKLRRGGTRVVGIVAHFSPVMWLHLSRSSTLSKTDGVDLNREFLL